MPTWQPGGTCKWLAEGHLAGQGERGLHCSFLVLPVPHPQLDSHHTCLTATPDRQPLCPPSSPLSLSHSASMEDLSECYANGLKSGEPPVCLFNPQARGLKGSSLVSLDFTWPLSSPHPDCFCHTDTQADLQHPSPPPPPTTTTNSQATWPPSAASSRSQPACSTTSPPTRATQDCPVPAPAALLLPLFATCFRTILISPVPTPARRLWSCRARLQPARAQVCLWACVCVLHEWDCAAAARHTQALA